jgi:hypothetical protein
VIRVSTVVLERVDIMKRLIILPILIGISLAMVFAGAGITTQLAPTDSAAQSLQRDRTLSVYGVGSATGPAEALTLQLVLEAWGVMPDEFYDEEFDDEEFDEEEVEAPGDVLQPVIDAAIDAGIDEADISVLGGWTGYEGTFRLNLYLDEPDQEQIQELFAGIEEATRFEELYIIYVGGYYEYSDCAALESEAFEAAVESAEQRAERLAAVLDMELGAVVDAAEELRTIGSSGLPGSTCDEIAVAAPMSDLVWWFGGMMGEFPPFDPDADVEVRIERVVHLTFAAE